MSIESDIIENSNLIEKNLLPFGFSKGKNGYTYSKLFMNDSFRADIFIDRTGLVFGKVFEIELGEEYTNFRIEHATGKFINLVRDEYVQIIKDIADNCYQKQYFLFAQSNRIANYVYNIYKVMPEFLWEKTPNCGVFRNSTNGKWFGIIMNVDKSKIIPQNSGLVDVLNVKLDDEVLSLSNTPGIYPAYHMNKEKWVSIILDDTLSDEKIMDYISISHSLSNKKGPN